MNQNPIPNRLSGSPVTPSMLGVRPDARLATAFLSQAFLWMFAGLLLSAGVAWAVQSNEQLLGFARDSFLLLVIGQLALVFVISGAINRINASVALLLFFVYAATLGVTLGLIVSLYSQASVVTAFLSASSMFGAAALYGAVTKRSLTGLGGILAMGVVGLIVAMVINLFLASAMITWVVSVVGVVIFTALTAYDVQRIGAGDLAAMTGSMEKAAVLGALRLYLDFINLFLFMLRLLGGRN
ncbi:MAG TPA: Bax inhibitor-1/YccA family protein [Candidatus Limnocylindrales bacterium]